MDAQQQARTVGDGGAVVVDVGAVGGADFAQDRAGAGHDVGDAEAVADLDQFAAGDDDFAAGGQFVEREKDGGGVVVDGDRRGAEEPFEQAGEVHVAFAAAAGGEIVFQVGVARGERGGAERRASQVGVQDDAGGVDDAAQRGLFERGEGGLDAGFEGPRDGGAPRRISARAESRARRISATTEAAGKAREGGREALDHLVNRGKFAKPGSSTFRWYALGYGGGNRGITRVVRAAVVREHSGDRWL